MPSMRAVLEGREKAALVRVEELRADLVRAEEVLRRRAIGLEEYLEALAGTCDVVPVAAEYGGSAAAGGPVSRAGREPRRLVARKDSGVSAQVLGQDYRRIMEAFDGPGGPGLTAKQVAVHLGWDTGLASRVEGVRGRMKRLVERGWLCEDRPGVFTLPSPSPSPSGLGAAAG